MRPAAGHWNRLRLILLAAAVLAVGASVGRVYHADGGLMRFIHFGGNFSDDYVADLKGAGIDPWIRPNAGYDGQFYANLALDPLLQDPEIGTALDAPRYRARRIGLPWLAHWLGAGQPQAVLTAYALLNPLFWLLLLALSWRILPARDGRSVLAWLLLVTALGAMESTRRALTDLPAATLLLLAVHLGATRGGWVAGYACLTKETSVLGLAGLLRGQRPLGRLMRGNFAWLLLAVLPLVAWLAYVNWRFPGAGSMGSRNFSWPGAALAEQLRVGWQQLDLSVGGIVNRPVRLLSGNKELSEVVVLTGLTAQALYLLAKPRWSDPFWRMGAPFALLLFVLGEAVLGPATPAARSLLPMTFAFCVLLAREQRAWVFWPLALVTGLSVPFGLVKLWVF